jgi:hypothetical protein
MINLMLKMKYKYFNILIFVFKNILNSNNKWKYYIINMGMLLLKKEQNYIIVQIIIL